MAATRKYCEKYISLLSVRLEKFQISIFDQKSIVNFLLDVAFRDKSSWHYFSYKTPTIGNLINIRSIGFA